MAVCFDVLTYEIDSLDFVSIHLYPIDSIFNDSTIYNQKPFYIGNTLDSVYFELNSLAPGKYEFIAIKDQSKNYYFDQSFDKIGFFEKSIYILFTLMLYCYRED